MLLLLLLCRRVRPEAEGAAAPGTSTISSLQTGEIIHEKRFAGGRCLAAVAVLLCVGVIPCGR
jgi:hypothetical protein